MAVVLVVDDQPTLTGAVVALVRSLGHEAVVAGDGADALNALHLHRVDLVITDIEMPNMSGLDLIRALPVRDGSPPVIVFSGREDCHREAMRLGAVACVTKTDPLRLVPLIREHLPRPVSFAG